MNASPEPALSSPRLLDRLRFQITAFTTARLVLNTLHRMVYPFLPFFSRGLAVDLSMLSLAVTLRSLTGVFGPFLASVADSRGRKAGMLIGMGIYSIGTSLVVIWPVFPVFVLSLVLAALGKLTFEPSMQAYLGDRIPYKRRGLAMALTELSWSFAFIVGVPLVGLVIARSGWASPFWILALLGLLVAGLLAWILPADPAPDADRAGLWKNLGKVLSYASAIAGLALGIFITTANETVNLMFGVWMEDSFGLKIAALGVASAVIGLSELGGESLVGTLADRLGKPRSIAAGLIFNCLAVLALPLLGRSLIGALVGLFFFYITFEFTIVSSLPLMTEVLPAARATYMAVFVSCVSLGRSAGDLIAAPLYRTGGILLCALAAVFFNLLALYALRRLISGAKQV